MSYVKIQVFGDRSFVWFVNYFCAKFLEILTTGSLEIGKFLQKQSVSIFGATAHALHLTPRIAGFFASLPFLTYLWYERLKPSTNCVQLRRKIAKIGRALSK